MIKCLFFELWLDFARRIFFFCNSQPVHRRKNSLRFTQINFRLFKSFISLICRCFRHSATWFPSSLWNNFYFVDNLFCVFAVVKCLLRVHQIESKRVDFSVQPTRFTDKNLRREISYNKKQNTKQNSANSEIFIIKFGPQQIGRVGVTWYSVCSHPA